MGPAFENLSGQATIWTIGHSNRTLDVFHAMLQVHRVEAIADVRRHPGSRAHPHFNADALAASLAERGIAYEPFGDLGGRRATSASSSNTIWRNASFRAYADFMETADFREALSRLVAYAGTRRTAIMCSEAVWWRCHRSLIADTLKARGTTVLHIMDARKVVEHPYTSAARIVDGELSYRASTAKDRQP